MGMAELSLAPAKHLDRATAAALADASLPDSFAVLGPHRLGETWLLRVFLPGANSVDALNKADGAVVSRLERSNETGLFEGEMRDRAPYVLRISWPGGVEETEDPYGFGLLLGDLDLHLFNEGRHFGLADSFGAQAMTVDGVPGVRFVVWAPNARRLAVVGDFNSWDARRHPMRRRYPSGIWEIFIPRIRPGPRYKYDILDAQGMRLPQKADPVARRTEPPPATASVVAAPLRPSWRDQSWMESPSARQAGDAPISIYEVHLGSWFRRRAAPGSVWEQAIDRLIPYAVDMGFTHIELMPITEHPFGGSWGYQPTGLFATSARYGTPQEFSRFVDAMHAADLGLILDWVPAHFPTDPHGLARFDGSALYEHLDPREGFHRDWNTLIYNFGRREVAGFLIASALFWLEKFHVDGLRVDAVASMLYRDYSRPEHEWIPNVHGGRENLEAIAFLRHLNAVIAERCPGAMTIAEESTAWPGVTRPVSEGGLGFAYKWNMGWMHDTLRYFERDPVHRPYHHGDITFGLLYAFSERFILPLSHDEVVHGKRSLLSKMPGDRWQRFANLRAYLGFMWAHPGKKLLFMGGEIAQEHEWSHDGEVEWDRLDDPLHAGVQRLVRDLNRLYRTEGALHQGDWEASGFRWVIGDDRANAVFAFLRLGHDAVRPILVVANMTPVPRRDYRVGVPHPGTWREIFNSDSDFYGGSNLGNAGAIEAWPDAMHGEAQSLDLLLPPLAVLMFRLGD
jgi:1,4-alpha-glucan branching enzyme